MATRILIFQLLMIVVALGFFGVFLRQSRRARRIVAGMWIWIGSFSLFWMEAPWDWSMYLVFNEHFWMLPRRGPFVTYEGLPVVTPLGYAAWFTLLTAICVVLSRRVVARTGWNPIRTTLGVSLGAALVLHTVLEATTVWFGIYQYGRTAPGLVLFPGRGYQYPLYVALTCAMEVMAASYLWTRRDDRGRILIEALGDRLGRSRRSALAIAILAQMAWTHAFFYIFAYVPTLIAKRAGWQTVFAERVETIPQQPGHEVLHGGGWGTILIVGTLLVALTGFITAVLRLDPLARRQPKPSRPEALATAASA